MKYIILVILLIMSTIAINAQDWSNDGEDAEKMLIVLSAPSIYDPYYEDVFEDIVDFQIHYAQTVMSHDNIVILVNADTRDYYDELPDDIILEANVFDIWMRDFTTVIPSQMLQFAYAPSYFENQSDADDIQTSFIDFAETLNLDYDYTDWALDGGNIVDNNVDMLITTERFLEDNNLTLDEGKQALRDTLNIKHVSIIPYDDEIMGHADGMVMFSDKRTVLVNAYDEPFRSQVLDTLKTDLPDAEVVEVPANFEIKEWNNFASACGVNLNSTVTYNYIYTPTFDSEFDAIAVELIQTNTDKTVMTIPASGVCFMGGSVRCFSWQVTGDNAKKIIEAAR